MLKRFVKLAAAAVLASSASFPALAYEGAAPSLSGVGEMLLRSPHVGNREAAEACGVGRGEFMDALAQSLKSSGVTVIRESGAKPPVIGVARIDVVPEIVVLSKRGVGDCTSWISLSAQTNNTIRIPPVEAPRSVTVVYWKKGILVSSGETAHSRTVSNEMAGLGRDLGNQHRVDQPPALPELQ